MHALRPIIHGVKKNGARHPFCGTRVGSSSGISQGVEVDTTGIAGCVILIDDVSCDYLAVVLERCVVDDQTRIQQGLPRIGA